jgi:HK97 gp10 family phage protein
MTLTFTITGIEEFQQKINLLTEKLPAAAFEVISQAADKMVSDAKSFAPVRTGFLRDNISITNQNSYAIQVSSVAYYSAFVEFGTSKMQPEPFFLPAIMQNIPTPQALLAALGL